MLSYIFYLTIVISFTFLIYYIFKVKNNIFQIICIICIVILYSLPLAFRGTTGTDSLQYYTIYKYGLSNWRRRENKLESVFLSLMSLCKNAHLSVSAFFFLLSFISLACFCLVLFLEQARINVGIAAFLYMTIIYVQSFNICRQVVAISLVLFALDLVLRKRRVLSIVLIVLAMGFHISAIVGFFIFILIILYQQEIPKKYLKNAIILALLVFLYCSFNPKIIANIVNLVLHSSYYAGYFNTRNLSAFTVVKNIIISAPIFILLWKKLSEADSWAMIVTSIALFGLIVTSIGGDSSRAGLYLLVFCSLAVAIKWYSKIQIANIKFSESNISLLIYVYYLMLFLFHYFYKNYGEIIPYIPLLVSSS